MEFNSQICTTKEQSERLLALGLKKETADMKYPCTTEYYGGILTEGMSSLPMIINTEDDEVTEYDLPSWSLHRLIELSGMGIIDTTTDNIYDKVIVYISYLIKCESFNKNYLEQ